jgi:diacylglycerol kinase family enzyme
MELGLGRRLERAAHRLVDCVPREIALGQIERAGESRHFLLMAGTGLDARIVFDVNPSLKRSTGKLAYWVAGFRQFVRLLEQFDARIDGKTYRLGFLLASRIRNYGGDLEIASGASLLHDDFEVVLFRGANPLRYAVYMLGVAVRQVLKMPGVQVVHARNVEILTPVHTQIDGEYAGREPVRFSISPHKINLLMPPNYG